MQMGNDFEQGWPDGDSRPRITLSEAIALPGDDHAVAAKVARHPDWAGLRARFLAIHALRRTLADHAVAPLATGSFLALGESVLTACREAPGVNPVYSANRKSTWAITGPVAVPPNRGDRGLA